MSEEITPALTKEQWSPTWNEYGFACLNVGESFVVRYADGRLCVNGDNAVYDQENVELLPPDRHGIAALCLFGHPFGFTREDVTALRVVAYHQRTVANSPTAAAALEGIAARIAALLPPEL